MGSIIYRWKLLLHVAAVAVPVPGAVAGATGAEATALDTRRSTLVLPLYIMCVYIQREKERACERARERERAR
jgi:hypothetical protein